MQWISIEDRKPKGNDEEFDIIATDGKDVFFCNYHADTDTFYDTEAGRWGAKVTHWMNKPEPPNN